VLLFSVSPGTAVAGQALRDLPLPPDVLAMLIVRGEEVIPPRGSTLLQTGDFIYIFAKEKQRAQLERLFQPDAL